MRGWILLYGGLFCALGSLPAAADSCIWFADDNSIRQVQASTNQITASVNLREVNRLVMNAGDCSVWVLNKQDKRLLQFSDTGALMQEIRVRTLEPRLDEVEQIGLDPYDASLWLTDERRIIHVSSSGQVLASFRAPGKIRDFRIATDQTLWVLGNKDLWHLGANGALLAGYPLARHIASETRQLEIDSVAGLIWLVGEKEVVQAQLIAPGTPVLRLVLPHEIEGLTLDPLSGNVWVAQERSLLAYGRDGGLVVNVDLRPFGIREPEELAFDPASRSLWVGSERSVSRFTDAGQFVVSLPARDGGKALGVPAFKVEPTLTLVRPPQNALTHNPQLQFTLAYDTLCNSRSCGFGADYLARYSLTATLNGQSVQSLFVFDPTTGQTNFTPAARLPEGGNAFSARLRDPFGHGSNTVTNNFTVDTIAPRFLAITPTEGSVFSTPNVVIQGSTDDPTATVVLAGLSANKTGDKFSFPVLLRPGLNTFVLSATDPAGNTAEVSLHLTLTTVSVTVTSPASGATINGDSVTVSGTVQGPINTGVAVNGVAAVVIGNTFTALNVPLQKGANTLTVAATTPDRQTATQTVSVTSSGPALVQVAASPAQGVAPVGVTFTLSNRTGNAIQSIRADYTGSGSFVSVNPSAALTNSYTAPGTYQAGFIITDSTGATYTQIVPVIVQDAAQIDQTLRAAWSGFTTALASRDTTQALQYFNNQAQEKYQPVLQTLAASLPQIAGSFSQPRSVSITDGIGEYAINRTIDGINRIFFIYFLRDADGVWRIDSM